MISLKKKEARTQIRKEETKTLKFIVGGVVILAIALLALLFYRSAPPSAPTSEETKDLVVAKINEQEILKSQLGQQYARLPTQFRQILTEEQVLEQMIDEALLLQKAKALNIEVNDPEIQTRLKEFLKQNNVDEKVFDESLKRQGISPEDVNELFRKQVTIQLVIEKQFGDKAIPADKEIVDYYNKNIDEFRSPPATKVRHILVAFGNNTPEQTEAEAERIRALIKPDFANFCEFVISYSDDEGSKKTCGEYTYTPDTQFVPEFKEAGEKQGVNQISIVKTQFGYHIIQTLAKLPERFPKIQDVREDIATGLKSQKQRELLKIYLEQLRKEARIQNFLTNQTIEPTAEAAPSIVAETKPVEPLQPKTKPTNLNSFALCLSKNQVALYGSASDLETRKQFSLFGEAGQYLNFVECSYLGNPNVVRKECVQKGVGTYPTWIINGVQKEGVQELKTLAGLTGCTI